MSAHTAVQNARVGRSPGVLDGRLFPDLIKLPLAYARDPEMLEHHMRIILSSGLVLTILYFASAVFALNH